jgi:hypothetical protein
LKAGILGKSQELAFQYSCGLSYFNLDMANSNRCLFSLSFVPSCHRVDHRCRLGDFQWDGVFGLVDKSKLWTSGSFVHV